MSTIYLIIAFVLNAGASILLKVQSLHGLQLKPFISTKIITHNIYFIGALALFGLNVVFYTLSLSRIALSVANLTMVVMSFLIVSLFSYYYFKESISALQIVGYILIIAGLILVISYAKAI
jgi:multidrug transporter EmrE-like cation transporter